MTHKVRHRKGRRQPRKFLGRYSTGEMFLAVLGAAILVLIVVVIAAALVGGG